MNAYLELMRMAVARAEAHGCVHVPMLSPLDETVLGGAVPVAELQRLGVKVLPWTANDPAKMRALIGLGVDGIISDRPDLLREVVGEREGFDVQGHRGARGLRPENTLPAFEAGLDCGVDTLEMDTGVTRDGVSLIWHDQFLNPRSCRRIDGAAMGRVYVRDVSMAEAQAKFVCDKMPWGPSQSNGLDMSPVAVAFAAKEGMAHVYAPTYVEQMFRFVEFYAEYHGGERADAARRVRFNIETKLVPGNDNHTVGPQAFVDALCGAIARTGMEQRCVVQSFDFRTLRLVEEQWRRIGTSYLVEEKINTD